MKRSLLFSSGNQDKCVIHSVDKWWCVFSFESHIHDHFWDAWSDPSLLISVSPLGDGDYQSRLSLPFSLHVCVGLWCRLSSLTDSRRDAHASEIVHLFAFLISFILVKSKCVMYTYMVYIPLSVDQSVITYNLIITYRYCNFVCEMPFVFLQDFSSCSCLCASLNMYYSVV